MKALNRFAVLIIIALSFISSNAQDFEGVWYPSSDEGMIGNIKIKRTMKIIPFRLNLRRA